MASGDILSDFGINLLEEEIDDVIFQTNEFLTDATFTGSQGPFWWILQMCMALAALFAIIMAAGMAYKMMVKNEPLDIMKPVSYTHLGKVADKVSDSTFLWCDALLRRVLCAVAFRHRALHTGREPDGNHGK